MKVQLNFKGRIVSAAMAMLTLSMIILSIISYRQLADSTKEDVDKYAFQRLTANTYKVKSFIGVMQHNIESSASLFTNIEDEAKVVERLDALGRVSVASDIILGYENGSAYSNNKGKYDASKYDPRGRGWYKQAKQAGKTIISSVYIGSISKKLMVTIAAPFYSGTQLNGVLSADIYLKDLAPFVKNASYEGAFAVLYDQAGLVISSTQGSDTAGKSRLADRPELKQLAIEMKKSRQGLFEFELAGTQRVGYFERIELDEKTAWNMLVAIDKAVVYRVLNKSMMTSIFTTLVMIGLSTLAIYLLISYTYRPVLALKKTINELSSGNGDLTKRLVVERNDDLGDISQDINTFIESLQKMMLDISTSSDKIASCVDELQASNQQNSQVLNAHKTETLQVATALNQMSATSHEVAHNTAEAVTFTSQTNTQTEQSKQVVTHATQNVSNLVNKVSDSSEQINHMAEEIANISAVLKVIGDIAEQTNLLALNAAIEAARAGEQGRGFAVVADEVRALASRTQDSTSEIHNTINRLNASSQSVIRGMHDTMQSCTEASEQTHVVVENLDNIVASVADINSLNMRIATAAEEQNAASEEINSNMVKISDMVDQVANRGEQVNQATDVLANANDNLTSIVKKFKLR